MTDSIERGAHWPEHVAGQVKFLVCVDASPPSKVAVHYACRRAKNTNGRVALLHVVQPVDFRQWSGVEEMMREEQREGAEVLLSDLARDVNAWAGLMPELMVREGRIGDEILGAVDDDPLIDSCAWVRILRKARESSCRGSQDTWPAVLRFRLSSFQASFPTRRSSTSPEAPPKDHACTAS